MVERFRLSSLSIEGFRGINKKVNINFNGKTAILFGPNGVGKSSIMQAIEWGIFGELIPVIVGPAEFKKEDAIVNSFNLQKKAMVEITLLGDKGKKVKITRERKLGKSSTAGKTEVTVEIDGVKYVGDEAQREINKLLKVTPAEFYASTYLHQEAIRDLIVGDPQLRSQIIDKLLGLHFVRELIEYLPVKQVAKEAKDIQQEIDNIKQRKMQEVVVSKKRLAEMQEDIIKLDIADADLNLTSLVKRSQEVLDIIKKIAQKMRITLKEVEKPDADLKSLELTINNAKKTVEDLEKIWGIAYKESVNETSNLKALRQSYQDAMLDVSSFEIKDAKELLTTKTEIEDEINKITQQFKEKISIRDFLQSESILVHPIYSNLEEAKSKLEKIERELGNEKTLKKELQTMQSQIEKKKEVKKQEEALSSLLVSAIDYLKSTRPKSCPICKSDISYQNVVSLLEREISERESAKIITKHKIELEELEHKRSELENVLNNLLRLQSEIEKLQSKIDEEKQKLKKRGFEPTENLVQYITDELKNANSQISNIDENIRKLKSELTQVNLKLEELEKRTKKLKSIESQVQKMIKTSETGEDLIRLLNEHIAVSEQNMKILEEVIDDIRALKHRLDTCEKILNFLKEKDKVDSLEKGLPAWQQRLNELEKKYSQLKELEAGLTDIYQAANTAREEMIKKALTELQATIGVYYSKIMCHPYYVNLQLIPDEERGKAVYRIRAWDKTFKQGTYVQTRFSNAQMNAVALSLFTSMATKLQSNLEIILLDDPSQSMDNIHKEALARLILELSQDKQLIIGTQDIEFEKNLERFMPSDKTVIYKLLEWSTEGPEIISTAVG